MKKSQLPKNIRELKESGYETVTVREEIRRNLIKKIVDGDEIFPGIIGYSDSVIPQIENAILAGQDMILLGERGQAKSRLIRSLVNLLDQDIPCITGCEINDNPYSPICIGCKEKLSNSQDATPISWVPRESRYSEKLATPDISVADLVGEIDPIKVAEGRYLSDEYTIHYGLIPRSNRGIFSINELPDLSERIQVSLFNLMEERDIQIKGYKLNLPLDVLLVASANPEDYTNRGRIITPLKDRYGAQIRTHYPRDTMQEVAIMEQEMVEFPGTKEITFVPPYMKHILAEITTLLRRSGEVNQRSGVSVRVSIANYESMISNAFKRSLKCAEPITVPRISDLTAIIPSTMGKVELETLDDGKESKLMEQITQRAVLNVFDSYFDSRHDWEEIRSLFGDGLVIETGPLKPSSEYVDHLQNSDSFRKALSQLGSDDRNEALASNMEFLLEGLHLRNLLNKNTIGNTYHFNS